MHDIHFPRVLCEFSGKRTGKRYKVQQAENRHHDNVKHFMVKYFLNDEPTCKYQNCGTDPDFIKELDVVWTECLQENLSIVCLDEDDKNGNTIAGCLLLTKAVPNQEPLNAINEKWAKIKDIMEYITHEAKPFENLNVQSYLTDLGLLVVPDYRKDGVGEKLLLACDSVCKANNLPVTVMTFSSFLSQNLAKKLGFQVLYSKSYEELRRIDPKKMGIDNIEEHTKDIIYMYRSCNNENIL